MIRAHGFHRSAATLLLTALLLGSSFELAACTARDSEMDGRRRPSSAEPERRLPNVFFRGVALVRANGQVMVFREWSEEDAMTVGTTPEEAEMVRALFASCDTTGCMVGPEGCVSVGCKGSCEPLSYPPGGSAPFAYTCCCVLKQ